MMDHPSEPDSSSVPFSRASPPPGTPEGSDGDSPSSPDPNTLISYTAAASYWDGVPASVNGMLGGLGQVSTVDIRSSDELLSSIWKVSCPCVFLIALYETLIYGCSKFTTFKTYKLQKLNNFQNSWVLRANMVLLLMANSVILFFFILVRPKADPNVPKFWCYHRGSKNKVFNFLSFFGQLNSP